MEHFSHMARYHIAADGGQSLDHLGISALEASQATTRGQSRMFGRGMKGQILGIFEAGGTLTTEYMGREERQRGRLGGTGRNRTPTAPLPWLQMEPNDAHLFGNPLLKTEPGNSIKKLPKPES